MVRPTSRRWWESRNSRVGVGGPRRKGVVAFGGRHHIDGVSVGGGGRRSAAEESTRSENHLTDSWWRRGGGGLICFGGVGMAEDIISASRLSQRSATSACGPICHVRRHRATAIGRLVRETLGPRLVHLYSVTHIYEGATRSLTNIQYTTL